MKSHNEYLMADIAQMREIAEEIIKSGKLDLTPALIPRPRLTES